MSRAGTPATLIETAYALLAEGAALTSDEIAAALELSRQQAVRILRTLGDRGRVFWVNESGRVVWKQSKVSRLHTPRGASPKHKSAGSGQVAGRITIPQYRWPVGKVGGWGRD